MEKLQINAWAQDAEKLAALIGRTAVAVSGSVGDDVFRIEFECGTVVQLVHHQSCCESVEINDISGDVADLIGAPLVMSEEVTNQPDPYVPGESYTWTFYRFATVKGYVTLRWLGQSNGYYSESVSVVIDGEDRGY